VQPAATTTYYVSVQGTGYCENAPGTGKQVTVTVNPKAAASDLKITGTASVCAGTKVTLSATSAVAGAVFTWYEDAQLQQKLGTGTTLDVTPSATTTYYATVQGTGLCENAPGDAASFTVTADAAPSKPEVSAPQGAICGGGTATLVVTHVEAGVTYHWYDAASGGKLLQTGTSYTTPALDATTTYYVEADNATGCMNAGGRTEVTVTVNPVPEPPQVKATDVTVCTGASATFTVMNPQAGITYTWYDHATGGAPVGTGENFQTAPLSADVTYYLEAESAGGCVSVNRVPVTATVAAIPQDPSVKISANPVCPGSAATLTATSSAGATFRWYTSKTGGDPVSTDNPFTTPALTASTTYYVEAISAGGCTNSSGRTEVSVTVLKPLATPEVRAGDATGSTVTFTWMPVAGAAGYSVSVDNGVTWTAPSSGVTGTTHEVTGLQPNDQVTIQVKALGETECQNSAAGSAFNMASNPLGDQFFVPNAFSPNGDGLNDVWLIYGNSIAKLHVIVWNQYGQKIFESSSQQQGWDGTFKGKVQPVGVYVYHLEVTFLDGKSATKDGDINIVR
jgi:gliding motility-associated-like protein